ncbi:AI-2E family transporter [Fructobacillus parabroussonetiae]|uniref:AI-2E family transporter n=1 Tax=Fructobacillus parabroussonetiae TaxID=2713174 RepID=A0ABS5QXG3_9LACO|nr:AI-2E family transporter [Fructobacillus parabroussonetiae]MBS9337051.1 AI-2E family transporter [Fructobacillus parabroussonetiae]MCK8617336.1 AI-2E family transporter [Fructobacillus parabroussonetiae]
MFPNDKLKQLFFWTIELLAVASLLFIVFRFDFLMKPIAVFVGTVFIPLLVSGFLYYCLKPLQKLIEKIRIGSWKMPRSIAVILTFTLFMVAVIGSLMIFVPLILNEISNLITSLPSVVNHIQDYVKDLIEEPWFKKLNLSVSDDDVRNAVSQYASSFVRITAGTLTGFVGAATSFTIGALTVPIILFYMLSDSNRFLPALQKFFPKNRAEDVMVLGKELDRTIERYISGQAIQMLFVGFTMSIGFGMIGLPYIWLLGFIAGVANIVPYVGPFIGVFPAVLVAVSVNWKMLIGIAVLMAIVQQVNGSIIYPALIGKSLRIHPLTVMLLLLAAGNLWGMIGMIVVVPFYAIARTIILYMIKLRQVQRHEETVSNLTKTIEKDS